MTDLALWLGKIGLGQYAPIFDKNDVDFRSIRMLSDQDLQHLGLSLGHRRILLDAIAQLPDSKRAEFTREAERRQLTVMFCDLAGSSALSEQFDAEDVREMIGAYRHACMRPIQRFGGFGQRFIGDGILVFFGYPQAHEDDAERAVRAGLDIIDAMAHLNVEMGRSHGVRLRVRIGIATGPVVVGDLATEASLEPSAVVGEAANLAARLQDLAEPDTIVVAPETRLLASRHIEYRDLGERSLKGFDRRVAISQVVRERLEDQLDRDRLSIPLIDRHHEMGVLLNLWRQAQAGRGQVVVVCGKAGIGKSRLTLTFQDHVVTTAPADGLTTPFALVFQCSPHFVNAALHPIIRRLQQLASIEPSEASEGKLAKLSVLLGQASADAGDHRLIADLLGIDDGGIDRETTIGPREKRQRTLDALERWIRSLCAKGTLLILLEDAQWLDPTSKLLLGRLVAWSSQARILILATTRTEHLDDEYVGLTLEEPWLREPNVNISPLWEFEENDARELVAATAKGRAIPSNLIKILVRKAEGNPLYIEELTKGMLGLLEKGDPDRLVVDPLAPVAIPTTLSGYLMARLDQVGSAREIAGYAAVIGREFSLDLLANVSGLPPERLRTDLGMLLKAELIRPAQVPGAEAYEFRHALIKDAAYLSLLRRKRREIHFKIAEQLERDGTAAAADAGDLVAEHYRGAGAHSQAVAAWERAAAAAVQRAAQVEATNLLEKALNSVAELPANEPLELSLTMQYAAALGSVKGVADPEVQKAYLRARALCEQLGESAPRFSIEFGLMIANFVRGDLDTASQIARHLPALAEHHPKKPVVDAYLANGMIEMQFGRFAEARELLEKAAALTSPRHDEPHLFSHGSNPGIFCQSYLAHVLAFMGHADEALKTVEGNLAIARERARDPSHLYSYVDALAFAGRVHALLGNSSAVKLLSHELLAISRRNHYAYFEAIGTIQGGWALAKEGSLPLGIRQMREGVAALEQTGTGLGARGFYVQIAEFHVQLGEKQEALAMLDMAEGPPGWGTRVWDAEIERVRGEIAAMSPQADPDAAQASFCKALSIARNQNARTLEVKAVLSYARFLKDQRRRGDAGDALASVLNEYSDTRDFPDLKDARLLLADLSVQA